MFTEFGLRIRHVGGSSLVSCRGELDLASAPKLTEAVDVCLATEPSTLVLDATGVRLLSTSGVEVLCEAAEECRRRDVSFQLLLSPAARRVLDLVGLWWLGLVEDGLAAELAMRDALIAHEEVDARGLRDTSQ